jgi:hypothetical protein
MSSSYSSARNFAESRSLPIRAAFVALRDNAWPTGHGINVGNKTLCLAVGCFYAVCWLFVGHLLPGINPPLSSWGVDLVSQVPDCRWHGHSWSNFRRCIFENDKGVTFISQS